MFPDTPLRRILVPTDFSEFGRVALEHAIELAKFYGAEIRALHVIEGHPVPLADYPPYLEPVTTPGYRANVEASLRTFLAPAEAAKLPVEVEIVDGVAPQAILDTARAVDADAIVLATHGHGGFERLVLGSVTEKVLRKADRPVLTVPNPPNAAVPAKPLLFTTLLCPVDFSEASAAALRAAARLAEDAKAHLLVLHVLESLPHEDPRALMHFNIPEYRSFLTLDAKERLATFLPAGLRGASNVEELITTGKPYREIERVAKERDAGLVVLGVAGRSAFDLAFFGSTANHVTRRATCPVLTIRA